MKTKVLATNIFCRKVQFQFPREEGGVRPRPGPLYYTGHDWQGRLEHNWQGGGLVKGEILFSQRGLAWPAGEASMRLRSGLLLVSQN